MEPYIHRVHYYETDKMGIVHHSNYVRWMEEARVAYLDAIGIGFVGLEARGIFSPVVSVQCRYHHPSRFDDRIQVLVSISEFKGVRLKITYEMRNIASGELVAEGNSEHCFTDRNGKPIVLKKQYPDVDCILRGSVKNKD